MTKHQSNNPDLEDQEAIEAEEAELDRLAAEFPKGPGRPEDLVDLMWAIAMRRFVRMGEPSAALFQFERFEALDTKFREMSMVIEARDPQRDLNLAIKLWISTGPEAEAALLTQAKMLAKLWHPNIVTVHETGKWCDRVYCVMQWVDGVDGYGWIEKPRTWQEIRGIFADAGTGLAAAHDAGIQHGDFRLENMLIGNDGRALVTDFGVGDTLRAFDAYDGEPEQIVDALYHMAPERLRGGPGSARSDQFSFCVAMWQALHSHRPYLGETAEELLEAIEGGEVWTRAPVSKIPHWLSQVVRKGLALDPDQRHRDMNELVRALHADPLVN